VRWGSARKTLMDLRPTSPIVGFGDNHNPNL
jgi:hypothetical protein